MSGNTVPPGWRTSAVFALAARLLLGGLFIYMGFSKVLHPVEFLKLVRQYDVLQHHLALNFVAATLPWFELFCGTLLVLGVVIRGAALMTLLMLVPFTVIIFLRALALRDAGGLPFCEIKFDCGCGAGEVLICRKLAENALLTATAAFLVIFRHTRFAVRPTLAGH